MEMILVMDLKYTIFLIEKINTDYENRVCRSILGYRTDHNSARRVITAEEQISKKHYNNKDGTWYPRFRIVRVNEL